MKGKQLSYDGAGELQNENGLTKLRHGSLEWANYLKILRAHGFCDVTAVAAFDGKTYSELEEVPEEIALEVINALKVPTAALTPEQAELAELKAQIAEMKAAMKPAKKVEEVKELEEVKEENTQSKRGRKPNAKKDN